MTKVDTFAKFDKEREAVSQSFSVWREVLSACWQFFQSILKIYFVVIFE